jgi:hypothetical protein
MESKEEKDRKGTRQRLTENLKGKKFTFKKFLKDRFGRGSQYTSRRNVVKHTLQDFARNMKIERSEDITPQAKLGPLPLGN